jgi:5-methylcytosine-specific restriction endonuclease McrA
MSYKGGITKNQECQRCHKIFDADRSGRKFCSCACRALTYIHVLHAHRGTKPRTYHLRKRDKHGNAFDREWRKAVFERDKYTCQLCGQVGGRLQADHIKPYKEFPELRLELSNGRTLCVPCHKKTPSYGWSKYWTKEARQKRLQNTIVPFL